jgi:hypothetical protein
VVLRPATSQDLCQGGLQGLEELRSTGEGSTELPLPRARGRLDRGSLGLRSSAGFQTASVLLENEKARLLE